MIKQRECRISLQIIMGYVGVLVVACGLRFWHIFDHGLWTYDDSRLIHFTLTVNQLFNNGALHFQPEFFSSAKPGAIFPFVVAALMSPLQADLMLAIFTAFWSVMVVVMTMVVAKRVLETHYAAICAGVLCAFSPLQLYFSKFNVAGALSMLFVLLTLYCYILNCEKSKLRNFILLGGVMGYAFTVNYSLLPFLLLIALLVLWDGIRVKSNKAKVHLIYFTLAGTVVPILFEIIYRILQLTNYRFNSYLYMLRAHQVAIGNDRQIYFDPLYYVDLLVRYEGVAFILAICGIYVAFKKFKNSGNHTILVLSALVIILLSSLSMGTAILVSVPRSLYSLIPLLPILGAVALTTFFEVLARLFHAQDIKGKLFVCTSIILLTVACLLWTVRLISYVENLQSGYKQAATWMNDNAGKVACFVHCNILSVYSDKVIRQLDALKKDADANFVVVDYADRFLLGKTDFMNFGQYDVARVYISTLEKSQTPKAVFNNSIGKSELFTLEQGIGRGKNKSKNDDKEINGQIRLYYYQRAI